MSGNPHMYLLAKALRTRTTLSSAKLLATRGGGGGHWHRPDPAVPNPYVHTRRIHLEDINTILYHDFSPEYHMHLHSHFIQNATQGISLIIIYFFLVILPTWGVYAWLQKLAGAHMQPALRPSKDHAHMAPRLLTHLQENNYEDKQDALGRRTGQFYKNYCRQVLDLEKKPSLVKKINSHGFHY